MIEQSCPLCFSDTALLHHQGAERDYFHCQTCDIIFVPKKYHVSPEEEKAIYDQHENDSSDLGYREFLSQVAAPLINVLSPGMRGLDVGSGPGPALNKMMGEKGFQCDIYDPYYANDKTKLDQHYDFVTCTETVEHFNQPAESWAQLFQLLKGKGFLAVMTLQHDEVSSFVDWWYKNDVTHVMFYSSTTFAYLAKHYNVTIKYLTQRVVIFER